MARAHRTYWRIRQRYRAAGFAGSALGAFTAAALIAPYVHSAPWDEQGVLMTVALEWTALFLAAVLAPPLAAKAAWRLHRRRYIEDMYQIGQR